MLIKFESEAIEHLLRKLPTAQQRINARKKIKEITAKSINQEIEIQRGMLREMRSESESLKRGIYAEISRLEQIKLEMEAGMYGF